MENNITKLYTTLSGGKVIASDEQVIAPQDFGSIMLARFIAELAKNGIKWNGEKTTFGKLVSNGTAAVSPVQSNGSPKPTTAVTAPLNGLSVGIDIQDINDLPAVADYWEDEFYKMKFTPSEIAYCLGKDDARQSFAGIYACKEALVKCDNALAWGDIEIRYNSSGKPEFNGFSISVSHSGNFAVAIAVKNATSFSIQPAANTVPAALNGSPASEKAGPTPKAKSYNKYFFVCILAIVAYIVLRDFVLK